MTLRNRPAPALSAAYRSALLWLGHKRFFSWLGPRVFAPLDTWLYSRVHGRIVSAGPPVLPLLMLTTTRRSAGPPRSVPLLYMRHGDNLVVVASNWGRPRHPVWSENLVRNPRATVQIGRQQREVRTRLATPQEKARLWPELLQFCPVWHTYATRSGRDLRVFVLEWPD
jgi:deazaflavin-dependent oxidoreductase (nitroreductase family)